MHDLCEGVIHYTLSNILIALIEIDKLFTLEELNAEIQKFNFTELEKNTPRPLLIESNKSKKNKIDGTKKKLNLNSLQLKVFAFADI